MAKAALESNSNTTNSMCQWAKTISPDFLLRSVLDHEVDEDRPQVCALGVAAQHLVEHAAASLGVAVAELQLSELSDHVHTWEGEEGGETNK